MNEEFVPSKKEECDESGCHIAIEPQSVEEKEKLPETAQLAQTLGIMTSVCQLSEEEEAKKACWEMIEPLEKKGKSAKDTIREYIDKFGEENLERSIKAFEEMLEEVKKEKEGKI